MSKKRRRSKQKPVQAPESTGVPAEEMLAEGSGPVAVAAPGDESSGTIEVVEAERVIIADESVLEDASPEGEAHVEARIEDLADALVEAMGDEADALDDHDGEVEASSEAHEDDGGASMDGDVPQGGETLEAADDELADLDSGEHVQLPTAAATMAPEQLKLLVEALVFASDKPITVQRLRQLTRVSDTKRLEQALADVQADYEHRGLILQQVSGGWQFRTRPQFSPWVQQLIAGRPVRLSRAQLETLAIIAYRQPITRPEIDEIRGVDSSATLKLLMDRQLIRVLGKKEEVGRPMLYGTTKEFLDFFSLGDLRELPTLREYSELTDESRKVMSNRLGIGLDANDGSGSGGEGGGDTGGGEGGGGDGGGDAGGSFGGGPMDGGDGGGAGETISAEAGDSGSEVIEASAEGEGTEEPLEASAEGEGSEMIEASAEGEGTEAPISADAGETTATLDASAEAESVDEPLEAAAEGEATDEPVEASADGEATDEPVEASADGEAAEEPLEASAASEETGTGFDDDGAVDEMVFAEGSSGEVVGTGTEIEAPTARVDDDAADAAVDEMVFAEGSSGERVETAADVIAASDDSETVDPLIAADALAHAETTVESSGETTE